MADKKKAIKIPAVADRRARMASVTAAVQKEYGNIVGVGHSMCLSDDIRRISTGSFMLDYAFGGGVPEGRISMFTGEKSSGKTTHALRIIAEAQGLCRRCMRPANITDVVPLDLNGDILDPEQAVKMDPREVQWIAVGECDCIGKQIVREPSQDAGEKKKDYEERIAALRENSYEEFICSWCDMEMVFDWVWARRVGVDTRRLVYIRPETGEEAIDAMDPLLRSGAIDLQAIDSIANFIPSVEITASTYEQQQGQQARLVNKGVRKFVSALSRCASYYGRVPTQVWINQWRSTMSTFGSGKVTPGGKGQGFATSVEMDCWSAKKEVEKIKAGNDGEEIVIPQSEELHFRCTKNKTAPPYIEGFYRQCLTDVDGKLGHIIGETKQLFRYAAHFGLLKKDEKSKTYTFTPTGFETKTQKEMRDHLSENMALLKAELMRILLLKES